MKTVSLANVAEVVNGVAVVVVPATFAHVEIDAGIARIVLRRLPRCPEEFTDGHLGRVSGHPRPLVSATPPESV